MLDLVDVVDEQGQRDPAGQGRRGGAPAFSFPPAGKPPARHTAEAGRPADEKVLEALKPVLQTWLDTHMPPMVERHGQAGARARGVAARPSPSETPSKTAFSSAALAPSSRNGYETTMLEKTYRPADFEGRLYDLWETNGGFAGRPGGAEPWCVMMPPPNVTGSLHMGHALNNTLQDVLTRYRRKSGRNALWQPGMDHAGIATQMVVERQLGRGGDRPAAPLARDAFIDRVWSWKAEIGWCHRAPAPTARRPRRTGRASASPWTRA